MKLTVLDVKYNVSEKKKAVACIIDACVEEDDFCISRVIPKKFRKLNPDMWENTSDIEPVKYVKSVAVTRVSDGDAFDADYGKRVAKMKCKIKLYAEVEKYTQVVSDVVSDVFNKDMGGLMAVRNREFWAYEQDAVGIELPRKIMHKADSKVYELCFDNIFHCHYRTNDNRILYSEYSMREMRDYLTPFIESGCVVVVEK